MGSDNIDNPSQHTEQGGGLEAAGSRLAAARRKQKLEPGAVASRLPGLEQRPADPLQGVGRHLGLPDQDVLQAAGAAQLLAGRDRQVGGAQGGVDAGRHLAGGHDQRPVGDADGPGQRVLDQAAQLARVDRFGQEVGDVTAVDRLGQHVDVAVGADQDALGARRDAGRPFEQLDPGEVGHRVVGHDGRVVAGAEQLERLVAARRGGQLADAAQRPDEQVQVVRLVVDDQYPLHHRLHPRRERDNPGRGVSMAIAPKCQRILRRC